MAVVQNLRSHGEVASPTTPDYTDLQDFRWSGSILGLPPPSPRSHAAQVSLLDHHRSNSIPVHTQ